MRAILIKADGVLSDKSFVITAIIHQRLRNTFQQSLIAIASDLKEMLGQRCRHPEHTLHLLRMHEPSQASLLHRIHCNDCSSCLDGTLQAA